MVGCSCGDDFVSKARHRIVVQSATETPDDAGGRSTVWTDLLTVWAAIETKNGKEVFLSSQLQSRVDAVITIRFQSSLADTTTAAAKRVKFGTRIYNVKYVKNLADDLKNEGRVFQQLLCVEGEAS